MSIRITIIGLGRLGASLGLALGNHKEKLTRIGLDRRAETALQLEKQGGIDKAIFNLQQAVDKTDLVILALPLAEIEETLQTIAPALRENAVVLHTSPAPIPAGELADKILPSTCHFLGFYPTLNPHYILEEPLKREANADLFTGGQVVITCANHTPTEALNLAADLAKLLGAAPYYCDPAEFQGWQARAAALPRLLAAALLRTSSEQPGWMDALKTSDANFAAVAAAFDPACAAEWRANRANISRVISQAVTTLQQFERALADQDSTRLDDLLAQTQTDLLDWQKQRRSPLEANRDRERISAGAESISHAIGFSQLSALFKHKK